ncbi:hypothetical protein GCM10020331_100770 [Ectobacillus funiculus]
MRKKFGFSRWAENWQEVVTDPQVDVVDIATPNAFHYEVAKSSFRKRQTRVL